MAVHVNAYAILNAARASSRVESKVGKGQSSGLTINGISVHPRIAASHPRSLSFCMTLLKYSLDFSVNILFTSSLNMILSICSRSFSSGK